MTIRAALAPAQRAAQTNNILRTMTDGRTAVSRRVKDLTRVLLHAVHQPTSDLILHQVQRTAQLMALSEILRNQALGQNAPPAADLLRLERQVDSGLRSLGVSPNFDGERPHHADAEHAAA